MEIFKCKGGATGRKIRNIMVDVSKDDTIHTRQACILKSLCIYLNEDMKNLKEDLINANIKEPCGFSQQVCSCVPARLGPVCRVLPVYLCSRVLMMAAPKKFLLHVHIATDIAVKVVELPEPDIADTPVGLVTMVTENSTGPVEFSPAIIGIVVEGDLVMSDIP
ncbi:hypothetical protein L3Q82_022785, partial [Scortum barcoo]